VVIDLKTDFLISLDTVVNTDFTNNTMRHAAAILQRDILKTVTAHNHKNVIELKLNAANSQTNEDFKIIQSNEDTLEVRADSEIGIMYGVLAISRSTLGIDDFWFWLDTIPKQAPYFNLTNLDRLKLPKYHVKYRGWFINDELLINQWDYQESNDYVWQLIFETLLRCGGNIVIPGTDNNAHAHRRLASSMGLMIAHHHAEPLGAEMFSRAYPNLEASYLKHPELFRKIWQDSIDAQKDDKVLWNIGFRGQGDRPFWTDEKHTYTLAEKADVINSVLMTQYSMVKEADPNAMCSMNIYGELTAIYNAGLLKIPEDVIQIWADNGYGKMISRRQGNDDPRSEVLRNGSPSFSQGIYYHVAFHDLQASNFLTLLQISPNYIVNEMKNVQNAGLDDLIMVNTGNIKPHVFYLRTIARTWVKDFESVSTEKILTEYTTHYYGNQHARIASLYQRYFETTFKYGQFEDQKVGDEFYTYTLRKFVAAWLGHKNKIPDLEWLTGQKKLLAQLVMIAQMIKPHVASFRQLATDTQILLKQLSGDDYKRLYNDLWLSIVIHANAMKGLQLTIDAFDAFVANRFPAAFILVTKAQQQFELVEQQWVNNPAPKWRHFYDNDCYTNITLTIRTLATLRSFIRIIGDGPDQDQWERQYLMRKSDAKVMLLSNTHKAYSDSELAIRLESDEVSKQFKKI
jgi:hypothetical protein